jgi:hypothetical protein
MGEVFGATQILKKIKIKAKENRIRLITVSPWVTQRTMEPIDEKYADAV